MKYFDHQVDNGTAVFGTLLSYIHDRRGHVRRDDPSELEQDGPQKWPTSCSRLILLVSILSPESHAVSFSSIKESTLNCRTVATILPWKMNLLPELVASMERDNLIDCRTEVDAQSEARSFL